jgi:hypothetical protein
VTVLMYLATPEEGAQAALLQPMLLDCRKHTAPTAKTLQRNAALTWLDGGPQPQPHVPWLPAL